MRTALAILALAISVSCGGAVTPVAAARTFATPEDAVKALADAVNKGDLAAVTAVFGPGAQKLIDSSDPAAARASQQVVAAAFAEAWRLEDEGPAKRTLLIGNEAWPFPVPIVRADGAWHFDTEAGAEEVIDRRIGRNELAVIDLCGTYVEAQRVYAKYAHDGKPAGLYARMFRSDGGRQNGLYWPVAKHEKPSPLGDLLTTAEAGGSAGSTGQRLPFHGYYFRILTAQGASASGGARDYMKDGELSGGFALLAWPAEYDVTGVMTFMVNQDGVVLEKSLGPNTAMAVAAITAFDPDPSWHAVGPAVRPAAGPAASVPSAPSQRGEDLVLPH